MTKQTKYVSKDRKCSYKGYTKTLGGICEQRN